MAYNNKYQQKAYIIIMCIQINVNAISCEMTWQTKFSWKCVHCFQNTELINICQRLVQVYTFTTMNAI